MPIELDTTAETFDELSPQADDMLSKLQTNILKSHGRHFSRHIFIQFTAPAANIRNWITQHVVPLMKSAWTQFDPARGGDGGLEVGLHISSSGYMKLGFSAKSVRTAFGRNAFVAGMKATSQEDKDPNPDSWENWAQNDIHILVTLADDTATNLDAVVAQLSASLLAVGNVVHVQSANKLTRAGKDVEHFGYRDGVSQPLFTRGQMQKFRTDHPHHNFERWNPAAPLELVLTDDPFTDDENAFGSYFVYRKLEQDVNAFDEGVLALARDTGHSPDLAGALAVGRFRDGTPVVRAKLANGSDDNDFDFSLDDSAGARCPVHAHIRKVNPRGTASDLASERSRRIARRAMPYGPPVSDQVSDSVAADPNPAAPRGLIFMCYQADIDEQFLFIQRAWADNVLFPFPVRESASARLRETGDDPLIGQDANLNRRSGQHWPLGWGDPGEGTTQFNFASAVTLRGGEFFFTPSLPFLRGL